MKIRNHISSSFFDTFQYSLSSVLSMIKSLLERLTIFVGGVLMH